MGWRESWRTDIEKEALKIHDAMGDRLGYQAPWA